MRFCVGLVVGAVVTLLFGFAGGWCWKSGLPLKGGPLGALEVASSQGFKAKWPPQHRSNGPVIRQPWVPGDKEDPCVPEPHEVPPRGDYEYHSSALEKEWLDGAHHGQICSTAAKQRELAKVWTGYTSAIFKTNQQPSREPTEQEASVLSYFEYPQADGTRVKRYIEPLHGVARHPRCVCGSHNLYDMTYLLAENACTASGGNRVKGVFMDLGAGTTVENFDNKDYGSGNNWGQSMPLFYNMYYDRCIIFKDIYAWEARRIVDHQRFWSFLPNEVRAQMRLYNAPVSERECPDSPQGNFSERGSFLRFLKSAVTVDDYVVVKVDIEGGPELTIVESIAHIPELSELVDELYFEYHFKFTDVPHPWGNGSFGGKTVDTALNLMLRLRQAGIRAHFWI